MGWGWSVDRNRMVSAFSIAAVSVVVCDVGSVGIWHDAAEVVRYGNLLGDRGVNCWRFVVLVAVHPERLRLGGDDPSNSELSLSVIKLAAVSQPVFLRLNSRTGCVTVPTFPETTGCGMDG